MAKFVVKSNVKHNCMDYAPGEIIELSEEEAAKMPHAVQRVAEKPAQPKQN